MIQINLGQILEIKSCIRLLSHNIVKEKKIFCAQTICALLFSTRSHFSLPKTIPGVYLLFSESLSQASTYNICNRSKQFLVIQLFIIYNTHYFRVFSQLSLLCNIQYMEKQHIVVGTNLHNRSRDYVQVKAQFTTPLSLGNYINCCVSIDKIINR